MVLKIHRSDLNFVTRWIFWWLLSTARHPIMSDASSRMTRKLPFNSTTREAFNSSGHVESWRRFVSALLDTLLDGRITIFSSATGCFATPKTSNAAISAPLARRLLQSWYKTMTSISSVKTSSFFELDKWPTWKSCGRKSCEIVASWSRSTSRAGCIARDSWRKREPLWHCNGGCEAIWLAGKCSTWKGKKRPSLSNATSVDGSRGHSFCSLKTGQSDYR